MLISPPFGGGRAPVLAKNAVASSQPLATQAGIEVLQKLQELKMQKST